MMADIHPWNVRGVKYLQPMAYGVYQSIPAALQYRKYSIELNAPASVSHEFVWNTIKEAPAMVQVLRDIDLCFSGIPMTERDDDDFGAEVILTVGDVRNIRGILDRIDGVVT